MNFDGKPRRPTHPLITRHAGIDSGQNRNTWTIQEKQEISKSQLSTLGVSQAQRKTELSKQLAQYS